MSHLCNPLATADQLYKNVSRNILPIELQDSVRFYTARLTQAAGVLLRLPQHITAQANVLLFRYWLVDDLMAHEFSDVSAATIYLVTKVSATYRSLRNITNVYSFLSSPSSPLSKSEAPANDPESYYLSESQYHRNRSIILHIEGQILNAIGFGTHVALPHPLAITYLQTLDVFRDERRGREVAKRAIEYLNTALLSPQMLYLTHQPNSLAVAAIYLAARDKAWKLPHVEWWEVFDVEREELGFLVVGMGSVSGVGERAKVIWGDKSIIDKSDVRAELGKMGIKGETGAIEMLDEEEEMARMLDAKVGDA